MLSSIYLIPKIFSTCQIIQRCTCLWFQVFVITLMYIFDYCCHRDTYVYKHIFWWNTWNDILSAMPNSSGFWSSCAYLFFLLLIPLARTARYTLSSNNLCKKFWKHALRTWAKVKHKWVVYWPLQWIYLSCWIARFCRFLVAAFLASFSAFLCWTRASFAS